MSKKEFYFADHTFIISYFFINPKQGDEAKKNYEKARNWIDILISNNKKIITTDFELMRSITNIFRETNNNFITASSFLNEFLNHKELFRWEFLPDKCFKYALSEFQKSDYNLKAEFLDLTSFMFIKMNIGYIEGVLAFHNHFREAQGRYSFEVCT